MFLFFSIHFVSMFITLVHYEKIPEETKTKINPKLWRRQVGPYCTFLINGKTKFLLTQGGKERGPVRITTGVRCIFLCLLSLERRGDNAAHPPIPGPGCSGPSGTEPLPKLSEIPPDGEREPEPSQGLCKYSLPKRSEKGLH